MTYTVGTLFSGIGVPDLCARLLGMTTVWQVEKEAFPQAVLRKNFPEAQLHGDIFDCHDLPYVDVIVAGFPCQPFSNAGNQQGERDPRYLVPEMLRVIDECRPRIFLLENVPGFASLDDGKSFKRLLQALAEMGFDAEWGHIRASDVGAPHQRERWFCVGYTTKRVQPDIGTRDSSAQFQPESPSADRAFGGDIAEGIPDDRRPHAGREGIVADASGIGRGQGGDHQPRRHLLHDFDGDAAQGEPPRDRWQCGAGAVDAALVNPCGARCEGHSRAFRVGTELAGVYDSGVELGNAERSGRSRNTRGRSGAQLTDGYAWDGGEAQPRLGRVLDGAAGWMDGFRPYPARPGQPQQSSEPPRVTSRNDQRAKRLHALGNSMAVDVVFEIMRAIRTWLATVDLEAS